MSERRPGILIDIAGIEIVGSSRGCEDMWKRGLVDIELNISRYDC